MEASEWKQMQTKVDESEGWGRGFVVTLAHGLFKNISIVFERLPHADRPQTQTRANYSKWEQVTATERKRKQTRVNESEGRGRVFFSFSVRIISSRRFRSYLNERLLQIVPSPREQMRVHDSKREQTKANKSKRERREGPCFVCSPCVFSFWKDFDRIGRNASGRLSPTPKDRKWQ